MGLYTHTQGDFDKLDSLVLSEKQQQQQQQQTSLGSVWEFIREWNWIIIREWKGIELNGMYLSKTKEWKRIEWKGLK